MKARNKEIENRGSAGTHRLPSLVGPAARARSGEEGGAVVEMALVLPLLLLIVTSIYTFAIAFNNYMELTNAVSIAARRVAVSRLQTTDPCADAVSSIESAAPQLNPANLSFNFVLNGTSYPQTSCSSSTPSTGAAANLVQLKNVQVIVTYPCNLAVFGHNYVPSCSMVVQTTEIVQ